MPYDIMGDHSMTWREKCVAALCLQEVNEYGKIDCEKGARLSQTTYKTFCNMVGRLVKKGYLPKSRLSFIYLMKSGLTGLYKIGTSKTPKRRETSLRSGDKTITLVWQSSEVYPLLTECTLHEHFHLRRKNGEWFDLSEHDINYVKENVK